MQEYKNEVEAAESLAQAYGKLKDELSKIIIGQEEVIRLVLISLFCNGHSLLVGVPGLAKTLLIKSISQALDLSFNRIQFTPDLMPSDILGAETLDKERNFKFIKGPIFSNIILADEINRTPPKTQAALLEAMQEKQVTFGGQNYELPKPFFVLATQNPIEQEGTYPLPEAQLDRFLFNIVLDYPSLDEEIAVVKATTSDLSNNISAVINAEEMLYFQALIRKVPVTDNVVNYAVKLVHSTRPNNPDSPEITKNYIEWGAGPRASQNLIVAAKCNALLNGKFSPDIEDVKAVSKAILRHRMVKNFKAEADGFSIDHIIDRLL